jgi:ABC-2 type transport system permease protein
MRLSSTQRERLSALAVARWQMFKHSLRSVRGRLELVSRTFIALLFILTALGGAIGQGSAAWYFVSRGHVEWLAFLLWPVLIFWQVFPVMASAFTENPESSYLLRFPLSYRSYFLVRIFYALFDPATFVGCFWLLGITLGVGIASPALLPWAAIVLFTFALFNLLLAQMIFAWIEKWLLQRRTREIFGILFFLLMLSFQFIGPLVQRYGHSSKLAFTRIATHVSSSQELFPPGASAHAIAQTGNAQWSSGLVFYAELVGYTVLVFWLLSIRFHAQYRGENLSETEVYKKSKTSRKGIQAGWNLPGLPGKIAAMFEKEVRYLARSGPLLFSLAVPLVMLIFFRVQETGKGKGLFAHAPGLVFPLGAAYILLLLTNLTYNIFGADSNGGVQFFFAAPVRLRQILIAKNLTHTAVFIAELVFVWLATWLLYQRPLMYVTFLTFTAALLILPVDFSAGNLLSIYSPKKSNPGRFGQQRAAQVTVLASFGIRAVVLGFVALIIWLCRLYGIAWLAGLIFLLLAGIAFAGYRAILRFAEKLAFDRREILITELGKKQA